MIPLVATEPELTRLRKLVERHRRGGACKRRKKKVAYTVGTMIEVPRAAIVGRRDRRARRLLLVRHQRPHADELRPVARRRRALPARSTSSSGMLADDPFVSLDTGGVGALMELAAAKGRATKTKLKLGICGEHGGDPRSIDLLPPHRPRLRVVLAVPRAGGPARRGTRRVEQEGLSEARTGLVMAISARATGTTAAAPTSRAPPAWSASSAIRSTTASRRGCTTPRFARSVSTTSTFRSGPRNPRSAPPSRRFARSGWPAST